MRALTVLIRPTGGHDGIAEYLEEGVKNGRDYTRDELDDRLIISGNLALTDSFIKAMDTDAERYLHITLAFKEDHIPEETLIAITNDFEAFAMAAYRPDEYNFYAEAHLPRIKTIIDKQTGEHLDRKPHIHIVIPETNIDTGKRLDPFGKITLNEQYIDAFQEVTNEKYGLASPKIHIRTNFTNESSVISRSKGDTFTGANKTTKSALLDQVITNNIASLPQLADHLQQQGFTVKERNQGKETAYLNIKAANATKGINLNDTVFTDRFLTLPQAEKEAILTEQQHTVYLSPKERAFKATPEQHVKLQHWHEQRAHEVRFVTRRSRAEYKLLSPSEQKQLIQSKKEDVQHVSRSSPIDYGREIDRNLRTADGYLQSAQRNSHFIEPGGRNVVNRRTIRAFCAIVQGRSNDQGSPQHRTATRSDPRHAVMRSDVISHQLYRHHEQYRQDTALDNIQHIKRTVDATALLNSLAQSHGLHPGKYKVTIGSDGGSRITCGQQKLNVGDFLTKEMHLPWKEAKVYLENIYKQQHEKQSPTQQPHDRTDFYQHYQPSIRQAKDHAWKEQFAHEKAQRTTIRDTFWLEKHAIYHDKKLARPDRNAAISIAAMNKVIADLQLKQHSTTARQQLKIDYPHTQSAQFTLYEQRTIITEKNTMRTASGIINEHGSAPYNHIKENTKSYYVKLEQPNGEIKTVWGKGLEPAINESNIKIGENVTLTKIGENDVTVPTTIKDGKGHIIGHEKIEATRNEWLAEITPQPTLSMKENETLDNSKNKKMTTSKNKAYSPQQTKVNKQSDSLATVNRQQLDTHLEASRLLIHYPQLKSQGIKPEHITKTEKGDIITLNNKQLTVTQLIKETTQAKTYKEVVRELTPYYQAQERDKARVLSHKEKYINTRPSIQEQMLRDKNNDVSSNKPLATMQSKDHATQKEQERKPLPPQNFDNVTHKINKSGHVSYYLNKDKIVVDKGKDVYLTHPSDKAIEIGLRLSIEKFGRHLDVNGNKDYKDRIINIAVKEKMELTFTDPEMNIRYKELQGYKEKGQAVIKQAELNRSSPQVAPKEPLQPHHQAPQDMDR